MGILVISFPIIWGGDVKEMSIKLSGIFDMVTKQSSIYFIYFHY